MIDGEGGYVLPRYENTVYIKILKGDHFGLIDLVFDSQILNQNVNLKKASEKSSDIYRRFTVQAIINCELLLLNLKDLDTMKIEFPDIFDEMFMNSFRRLKKAL